MEMEKLDYYSKEATIRISIEDWILTCLETIEEFLNFIKERLPNSVEIIINTLKENYGKMNKYDISLTIPHTFKMLHDTPELENNSINALLSLINYSKYQKKPINKKQRIKALDFIRASSFFSYYWTISLKDIIPNDKIIDLYKTFIEKLAQQKRNPKFIVPNLDKYMDFSKAYFKASKTHSLNIGKIDEGKLVLKIKKCMFADLMESFKDPEFSYAAICYYDFEAAKNTNPNFILTRKKTLMQGAEYCDFCYHDTRLDKEIQHPPEEFWEKI